MAARSFEVPSPRRALVAARDLRRMLAATVVGPGRVSFDDVRMPEPAAGEIRVKVEGCGVGATTVDLWQGRDGSTYPLPPGAPGDEVWGRVDALGPGVLSPRPGDRVGLFVSAGYAEYAVAPAAAAVVLPPHMDGKAFPASALAGAINVFRRSGIRAGHVVAVVGVGFLGALLTRLSSRSGAEVVAVSRRRWALDLARRMGARSTVVADEPDAVEERVRELTDGRGCDRVVEAVGRPEALALAARLARERGRLVIAGSHPDGPCRVDLALWMARGLDVTMAQEPSLSARVEALRAVVDAVDSGLIDPAPLCSHDFRLHRLADALRTAAERPNGFLKAVVRP